MTSVLLTMAARMKYGVANEKEIRWTSLLCSIVEFVERGPFDSACRSKVFYHEMVRCFLRISSRKSNRTNDDDGTSI